MCIVIANALTPQSKHFGAGKQCFPTVLFVLANSHAASKIISKTNSGFLKSPCTVLHCSDGVINECEPEGNMAPCTLLCCAECEVGC